MKKLVLSILGGGLVLLIVVVVRAALVAAPSTDETVRVEIAVDEDRLAQRMSQALQFRTISPAPPAAGDPAERQRFIDWLARTWPRVHRELQVERVADSVLFTWAGSDLDRAPILLTSHYDVVPVIAGTEELWEHPPFSGTIADGRVWGRGALDNKSGVVTTLEAVDWLLESGFRPERTVYLSFGHDEERGGRDGAGAVAALLAERGVRLAWSLDEGSFMVLGVFPGIEPPVASINVAEKGYLNLEIVARGEGGHSSMPPPETAVGVLSEAIVSLQRQPMPGGLDGVLGESFDAVTPHLPFGARLLFANRWLFDPLLVRFIGRSNAGSAMLRTTTAPTMLEGSPKENVLPIEAIARVNFRIHPRDTFDDVLEHARRAIDDERVEVRRTDSIDSEPSAVSSTDGEGFLDLAAAVRDVEGGAVVIPGVTLGGTDSRHYGKVADDAYRFVPMIVTREDVPTVHGTNEKVSIDNLVRATRVYIQLLRRSAGSYSLASK
jgi:carboxypeptidase PM20D1